MRKTILVVLMVVIVATPCLADEVEPEGLFSIEGTSWQSVLEGMILPFPHFGPGQNWIGFSGGVVYYSRLPQRYIRSQLYLDMMVASIFMYNATGNQDTETIWKEVGIGILQPASCTGVLTAVHSYQPGPISVYLSLLIKTDDNWTPPSE